VASGPTPGSPQPSPAPPQPSPAPKKGGALKWVLLILVLAVLALVGVLAVGGATAWFLSDRQVEGPSAEEQGTAAQDEAAQDEAAIPDDEDTGQDQAQAADPGGAAASQKTGSGTSASKTGSSGSAGGSGQTSSGSSSSGSSSSSGTSAGSGGSAAEEAAQDATGSSYTVRFVLQGHEAELTCGDGQKRSFVGASRISFTGVVTCMIKAGEARGAVQLRQAATLTCTISGDKVNCS